MNDAWDPIEDLEPLDDNSLGLLAAYHDAAGPSADAEARMLAGLRARLATESNVDDPATAVPPEAAVAPREQDASSNARTLAIAAVAFAAGVALTVSLSRPSVPQDLQTTSNGDAITRHDAAGLPGRVRPESFVPRGGSASSDPSVARGMESMPQRSWPLSIVDMAKPQSIVEIEPAERSIPRIAEPTRADESDEGESAAPPRQDADDGPRNRMEGATASRDPLRGTPDPAVPSTQGASRGAWAPSVSGAPAGAGIGSAARNPAVGGPAPAAPTAGSGASNAGGDGSSETPPEETPSPEPEPEDEPENEPEDEQPPEEICFEELDACMADANIFCDYGYPGCDTAYHFCEMRSSLCLDGDGGVPDPGYPPDEPDPDGPDPDDCETDYELCVLGVDTVCIPEHLPPEECENMMFQCDEEQMMCYGEPPPEPWW